MRLDRRGCRLGTGVAAPHDDRRAPLRLRQIPRREVPLHGDVAVDVQLVVNPRRAGRQGLERVVHRGHQLVLDVDEVDRPLRRRRVNRRNRRHLVSDAAHHAALERDVVSPVTEGPLLDAAGVNDGVDSGKSLGRCGVDRHDPGVRVRAALDRADQQAAHPQVVCVHGPPGDLVGGVELGDALPDDRIAGVGACLLERGVHRGLPMLRTAGCGPGQFVSVCLDMSTLG